MSRVEQLEAILRAQYELEYSEPKDLPRCLSHLNTLLDQAIAVSGIGVGPAQLHIAGEWSGALRLDSSVRA